MAKFFPKYPNPEMPQSERLLWDSFQRLDNHWRVFHSVAWQSKRGGREGDGEADFILLHPQKGALILEVKGGGVEVRSGSWVTVDRFGQEHQIQNPFEQAKDSKYALVKYFQNLSPSVQGCRVEHAVAFPDLTVDERFGMYGPRPIVFDRSDLASPEAAVDRAVKHWDMRSNMSSETIGRIVQLLAPTVHLRRRLLDDVAQAAEHLARLTAEQLRALAMLRRERRAVVSGGAGTGKTVLAMERARTLAQDGFRTALLCYNAPLAAWIQKEMAGTDVSVATFHALCIQQANKARIPIPGSPSTEWWEESAASVLLDAASKNETRFDAVVVDEAQDFSESWLHAIDALLSSMESSPLYLFVDQRQELYARGFRMPDWPLRPLMLNCRNTIPIATKVAKVFDDLPPVVGAPGLQPIFETTRLDREGRRVVQNLVSRLLETEGLRPDQIGVLSDDTRFLDSLRDLMVGDSCFTHAGGIGVVAESIPRFKGLEADVVILCLSDSLLLDVGVAKALTYVGFSRPRSVLYVLGSQRVREFLNW